MNGYQTVPTTKEFLLSTQAVEWYLRGRHAEQLNRDCLEIARWACSLYGKLGLDEDGVATDLVVKVLLHDDAESIARNRSWLKKTALRLAIDQKRRVKETASLTSSDREEFPLIIDEKAADPADVVVARSADRSFLDLWESHLARKDQEIFKRLREGWGVDAIAKQLNMTQHAVHQSRTRINREGRDLSRRLISYRMRQFEEIPNEINRDAVIDECRRDEELVEAYTRIQMIYVGDGGPFRTLKRRRELQFALEYGLEALRKAALIRFNISKSCMALSRTFLVRASVVNRKSSLQVGADLFELALRGAVEDGDKNRIASWIILALTEATAYNGYEGRDLIGEVLQPYFGPDLTELLDRFQVHS